jgi:serine/threonine protein kinase
MGDVAVCDDLHLSRKVVIKTLKPGQDDRRLADERRALLKLRSKHVVQLFDLIELVDNGERRQAIVLEYIEGSDLYPGQFTDAAAHLNVMWQIACGLKAIHDQQIVHRDIKPNNIRIDLDGVVKILDFGLARTMGVDAKTLSAIGTPCFMAPELWKSNGVSFDQSIDVYAFAATAILLRTGYLPPQLLTWPPSPIELSLVKSCLNDCPDDVVELLNLSLSSDATIRPSIATIEETIRRHLLRGKHRGLFVLGEKTHEINSVSNSAKITSADRGSVTIKYDGVVFLVVSFTGKVKINNLDVINGQELPDCCVITFESGTSRKFVTFDVSNPEVIS